MTQGTWVVGQGDVEQNDTGYMGCGSGCEVNRTTQGTWHVGQGVR